MQEQVTIKISFYCCCVCASRAPSFNTETLIVRVKAEEERNRRWTPCSVCVEKSCLMANQAAKLSTLIGHSPPCAIHQA